MLVGPCKDWLVLYGMKFDSLYWLEIREGAQLLRS